MRVIQLTIKMLTRVKSKQLYHSVLDDPWTNAVTDGEPINGPSPVHP